MQQQPGCWLRQCIKTLSLLFLAASALLWSGLGISSEYSEEQVKADLKAARAAFDEKRHEQAIGIYTRILDKAHQRGVGTASHLNLIIASYGRGDAYTAKGSLSKAISDYTRALEGMNSFNGLNDYKAMFHDSRGMAYYRLGSSGTTIRSRDDVERAVQDYTHAIRIDPTFIRAYGNRAVARYLLGQLQASIDDCNAYLKQDAQHAEMYYIRGSARINLKDRGGIDDIKVAAAMGHPWAKEMLKRTGIPKE